MTGVTTRSSVNSMRAFVPARDLALSKCFYRELGFEVVWEAHDACGLRIDGCSFILQQFYIKEHAGNFMMALDVEDVDAWWRHIASLQLPERYELAVIKAPEQQPWGLRVLFLSDPSGVLWHIAQHPRA